MRRLIAVTSVLLLGFAGSAFAQASMGMDSSGRFDGSPPLGTSPDTEGTGGGGLSIPIDFGTTTIYSDQINWTICPGGQRVRAQPGTPAASQACRDIQ
ncbi:hypothetical protein [Rhizobium grahamii]|uniref:Uncharacterized protein n=2 Tax=Rhizobium grahamii TaxID=1120045 RepID=S3H9B0_9HYPH|nr:hypothetical protein [Rhizobium grahamii]EPE94785.1 hypothetical protein RGCCGE502_29793 [Rhizobium grahamii CCGE 502]RDJ05845.1 hypothetical protein B5K06_24230 [Rhizobium grahamii]